MTLPATKNLIYNAHGTVDMIIDHPQYGWIPFTADPNDTEQLGKDLYAAAIAGTLGTIAAYIAPIPTSAGQKAVIQSQIDAQERAQLMPRLTREVFLTQMVAEAAAQGLTEAQLYAANIRYKKLKDFNDAITALRDQLNAIV